MANEIWLFEWILGKIKLSEPAIVVKPMCVCLSKTRLSVCHILRVYIVSVKVAKTGMYLGCMIHQDKLVPM